MVALKLSISLMSFYQGSAFLICEKLMPSKQEPGGH